VVTKGETIEADVVIIAAGSWSSDLTATAVRPRPDGASSAAPAPVRPIRGQLLYLQMPSRVASRVLWGHECYIVPWRDGSVLVGATVEDVGFDESATVAGVQQLTRAATRMLPSLARATFAGVRVGLRPATSDALPAIGRSSSIEGVVYATGHYRNGVLLAPLTAVLVADLVLNNRERSELSLTKPERLGL
jgi:glycine oxidase